MENRTFILHDLPLVAAIFALGTTLFPTIRYPIVLTTIGFTLGISIMTQISRSYFRTRQIDRLSVVRLFMGIALSIFVLYTVLMTTQPPMDILPF